jgi:hypothetical protein
MIPREFQLVDVSYQVRPMSHDLAESMEILGRCNQDGVIELFLKEGMDLDIIRRTYFHELAHALLFAIGEDELGRNEQFIERLGKVLHQYFQTEDGELFPEEQEEDNGNGFENNAVVADRGGYGLLNPKADVGTGVLRSGVHGAKELG